MAAPSPAGDYSRPDLGSSAPMIVPPPSLPWSDGPLPSGDGVFPEFCANPNSTSAPPLIAPSSSTVVLPPVAGKSYAAAIAGKSARPPPMFVTDLNSFHPTRGGNATFLKMPDELYQQRLNAFNYALLGRIFLPKQSSPRVLPDLKAELRSLFKTKEDWRLGKGFYSMKFASLADQTMASRFTSWRLKIGNFHVREWKPNFDPYRENTSITQFWVRLFHLPEEYWDPNFLVEIFRAVGNVVKLDGSTAAGTVGHFARALVEVNLSYPLGESVTIECTSSSLVVEFGFENLPLFCSYCRYIGHAVADCKSRKRAEAAAPTTQHAAAPPVEGSSYAEEPIPHVAPPAPKGRWRPKSQTSGVPLSNGFSVLSNSSEPPVTDPDTRSLLPLSPEVAEAIDGLKNKDDSSDPQTLEASDEFVDDQQLPFVAHDNNAMIIYQPDDSNNSTSATDNASQDFSRTLAV